MSEGRFQFGSFILEVQDRRLLCGGEAVSLNARYLDALILLVEERGKLVSKVRLHETVWRGVPVTDEALTQCIRTLRRQLGDDASKPRFIETVPKHGYRFIAPVESEPVAREPDGRDPARREPVAPGSGAPDTHPPESWRALLTPTAAGTLGGGIAGVIGGLLYGFVAVSQSAGGGALSTVLVLTLVTTLVATVGAAGVALGLAASRLAGPRSGYWMIPGGAAGGLAVGALVKLLGIDAFELLLGQSPGDITGAAEGAMLGAAIGLGARWAAFSRQQGLVAARLVPPAFAGAIAGALIPLLGGRLMGGSLALLADRFPQSRLSLDMLGPLFGEGAFGPLTQAATGALEGALFATGIVGAMLLAMRDPQGHAHTLRAEPG